MAEEQLVSMIATSKTKNILSRIYSEKTLLRSDMVAERNFIKGEHCFVPKDPQIFQLFGQSDVFLVGERTVGNLFLSIPNLLTGFVNQLWFNQRPIFEFNLAIYYDRDKPELGNVVISHLENGMAGEIYRCILSNARSCIRNNDRKYGVSVFENLESFFEETSGFSDLVLENFSRLFLYYFLFCSLVFLAFCIHHIVNFWKKQRRRRMRSLDRPIWTTTTRILDLLKSLDPPVLHNETH